MAQKDKICLVPYCGRPCRSRGRCKACANFLYEYGYDCPVEAIWERNERDRLRAEIIARLDPADVRRLIGAQG